MANYIFIKKHRNLTKKRIIYVMGGKCQYCGYNKCQSALELHHINKTEKDFSIAESTNKSWEIICNELKKCVLVCANCHREIHEGMIKQEIVSSFDELKAKEINEDINNFKEKTINYCIDCGKQIDIKAKRCEFCGHLARRKQIRPTREELKKLIREETFTQIGRDYGVTDNTIRKWCKAVNLPFKKQDIEKINDNDWKYL